MSKQVIGAKAPTDAAERLRLSRSRRQETGKRIDVLLSPEATKALEELRKVEAYGATTKDIVDAVIIKEAKRVRRKKEEP